MRSKKLMPYSIEIKENLYSSVKGASARYRKHLERKKSETVISHNEKENEVAKKTVRVSAGLEPTTT